MQGKAVIITGANSGIGFITARELARRGAQVTLACRNPEKGEAALQKIREETENEQTELELLDLSSLASVREFAARYQKRHDRLDVLLNNAGAYIPRRSTTGDGFETTFQVNHLGHFLLTNLLTDLLKASAPARVINVASAAHRMGQMKFDDLQSEKRYKGLRAYGTWKLGNILHANELSRRLEGSGVIANSLHPGAVSTGFAQQEKSAFGKLVKVVKPFLISAEKGARTSIYLASDTEVGSVSGEYFAKCKPARRTKHARSADDARRLWEVSEELAATK